MRVNYRAGEKNTQRSGSGQFMRQLLLVGILLVSTAPLYAQGQQLAAELKSAARNAVGTIGADKNKTKIYCQILELERQLEQVDHKKDREKKSGVLFQKINQLQKQVGPEFVTLDNILKHLDLKSPEGRVIALIIQSLNEFCPE
jgi:hypothetical protein